MALPIQGEQPHPSRWTSRERVRHEGEIGRRVRSARRGLRKNEKATEEPKIGGTEELYKQRVAPRSQSSMAKSYGARFGAPLDGVIHGQDSALAECASVMATEEF